MQGSQNSSIPRSLETLVLILWLLCLNASAIMEYDQFPALTAMMDKGWQIAVMNLCVIVLLAWLVKHTGLHQELGACWRRNQWLVVFLLVSTASLLWSVYWQATVYELVLLWTSTLGASYFAVRFRLAGILSILTWFAGICTLVSLFIVFFTPNGIMLGSGHFGSWRGLFWHRNHTGSLMAFFNVIFLVRLVWGGDVVGRSRLVYVLFYGLTAVHVFGSRSATGVVLFVLLNFLILLGSLWLKWHARIKRGHYLVLLFITAVFAILFFANPAFFFGLLGRSPTMTGRTMMWPDLLQNTYLDRPILGHGFATIWMQESFRNIVQDRWEWGYQPYFADNGYLDLLLNLGIAGLFILLWGIGAAVVRTFKLLLNHRAWSHLFLLVTLVHVIVANLTYSFLFEVDYFVWGLLVVVSFLVVMPDSYSHDAAPG
jgi:exopolysaccharide production protein ExoQ